jgi:hypothetical protein
MSLKIFRESQKLHVNVDRLREEPNIYKTREKLDEDREREEPNVDRKKT